LGGKLGKRVVKILESLFGSLARLSAAVNPSSDLEFHAEPIDGYEWARLAVGNHSVAILLPASLDSSVPKQDLEHIAIDPRATYQVRSDGSLRNEVVSIVATKGKDGWLITTFLELVAMLLQSVPRNRPEEVEKLIQDLVSLFRTLVQPATKTTQGMWGELFLIRRSADVDLAVESWHTLPNDRYDFSHDRERIEAKTTTGPRVHTFGHLQLLPVAGLRVTIASMVLLPSTDGPTCSDLVSQIAVRLKSDALRNMLVKQVVRTLGNQWQNQGGTRFDPDHASAALKFYDVHNVPRIDGAIPAEVSGISYQSDLQLAKELYADEVDAAAPLTRALMDV
jgi:hypothetical protein